MKQLTALVLTLMSVLAFAGDPIEKDPRLDEMVEPILAGLDSAASDSAMGASIDQLKELTELFPRDWRSYYWTAYAFWRKAEYQMDVDQKMKTLDQAAKWLKRSEWLGGDLSEIQTLHGFIVWTRIATDIPRYRPKYTRDLRFCLETAYRASQDNPRYFLLKGIVLLNDTASNPKHYDEARTYFTGAEYLFEQDYEDDYKWPGDPHWGFDRCNNYLLVYGDEIGGPSLPDDDIMNALEKDVNKRQNFEAKEEKRELPETLDEDDNPDKKKKKGPWPF